MDASSKAARSARSRSARDAAATSERNTRVEGKGTRDAASAVSALVPDPGGPCTSTLSHRRSKKGESSRSVSMTGRDDSDDSVAAAPSECAFSSSAFFSD